jgi:hypothetical protein
LEARSARLGVCDELGFGLVQLLLEHFKLHGAFAHLLAVVQARG